MADGLTNGGRPLYCMMFTSHVILLVATFHNLLRGPFFVGQITTISAFVLLVFL